MPGADAVQPGLCVAGVPPPGPRAGAGRDPADIAYADVHAGHGNFRAWSKITAHVVTALTRLDRPRPDREILQWVFSRLGGSVAEVRILLDPGDDMRVSVRLLER